MSDVARSPGEFYWREWFPWLNVVRAARVALQVRLVVLAGVSVLATIFGWWVLVQLFKGATDDPLAGWIDSYALCPWTEGKGGTSAALGGMIDDFRDLSGPTLAGAGESGPLGSGVAGEMIGPAAPAMGRVPADPLVGPWAQLSSPGRRLFAMDVTFVGVAFLALALLWAAVVWAVSGGIITRVALAELGRGERMPLKAGWDHVRRRVGAYVAAPLFPLAGVVLFTLPLAVLGLLMRLDAGAVVGGLLWPVALLLGVLMAILLAGLLFGWPLMHATISAEGTDSFDALSRSYSYVYQKPLNYLFYAVVAAVVGGLALLAVFFFARLVWHVTAWSVSWGATTSRLAELLEGGASLGSMGQGAATLLGFWEGVVRVFVLGFAYSYFWSATSAIYLLLRRDVDSVEMDEIFLQDGGESFGLPPLTEDPSGVPLVADETAAADSNGEEAPGGEGEQ